ncbi:unnamed protein product [Phaeothamnion confervicola]
MVAGSKNILVSNQGKVWSTWNGKELEMTVARGYHSVQISVDGRGTSNRKVPDLVAEAFVPRTCPPHVYCMVDHINRDKFDNPAENLRWSTHHLNSYNRSDQPWGSVVKVKDSNHLRPWQLKYRLPGDASHAPLRQAYFETEGEARGERSLRHEDDMISLEEKAEEDAAICFECHPELKWRSVAVQVNPEDLGSEPKSKLHQHSVAVQVNAEDVLAVAVEREEKADNDSEAIDRRLREEDLRPAPKRPRYKIYGDRGL